MAEPVPLNRFRLIAKTLDSGSNSIYLETINNLSAIILSSQITNVTGIDQQVTVKVQKSGSSAVTLLKDATIPPNEALNPFSGKVVLEKNDELLYITNTSASLETVLSVLENAND